MFDYEVQVWMEDEDGFDPEKFWRIRIINAANPDRACAIVLARISQQAGTDEVPVGTRVSGVHDGI